MARRRPKPDVVREETLAIRVAVQEVFPRSKRGKSAYRACALVGKAKAGTGACVTASSPTVAFQAVLRALAGKVSQGTKAKGLQGLGGLRRMRKR